METARTVASVASAVTMANAVVAETQIRLVAMASVEEEIPSVPIVDPAPIAHVASVHKSQPSPSPSVFVLPERTARQ